MGLNVPRAGFKIVIPWSEYVDVVHGHFDRYGISFIIHFVLYYNNSLADGILYVN
jgi:hypothetical protein